MNTVILKSEILTISKIKKRTKAKMLESLVVGDKIQLSVDASPAGGNRGTYATYIDVVNINTNEKTNFSFNQISVLYRAFDFEESDVTE